MSAISTVATSAKAFANSTTGQVTLATGKAIGWTFLAVKANGEASRNFLTAATTLDAALKAKTESVKEKWQNRTTEEDVA